MATSTKNIVLEARLHSLVDEQLFKAYQDAVTHFNTTDLVLCFDESVEIDPIAVYVREKLIRDTDIPESLRTGLTKPARDTAGNLSSTDAAFWLVSIFADGQIAWAAIRAKLIGQCGNA